MKVEFSLPNHLWEKAVKDPDYFQALMYHIEKRMIQLREEHAQKDNHTEEDFH